MHFAFPRAWVRSGDNVGCGQVERFWERPPRPRAVIALERAPGPQEQRVALRANILRAKPRLPHFYDLRGLGIAGDVLIWPDHHPSESALSAARSISYSPVPTATVQAAIKVPAALKPAEEFEISNQTRQYSAFVPLACVCAALGCSDGQPILLNSYVITSPNSKMEAVVERLDNGLGFGQGRLIDEIHIKSAKIRAIDHGSDSATSAFYIEAIPDRDLPVVEWIDDQHLSVRYSNPNEPGRQISDLMGVELRYRPSGGN